MEYVIFTEEEKERAGAANLVEFLLRQGEELEPSGSEWRWKILICYFRKEYG